MSAEQNKGSRPQGGIIDNLQQAMAKTEDLKRALDSGSITKEQFDARLDQVLKEHHMPPRR